MKRMTSTVAIGLAAGLTFWLDAAAQSPQPAAPTKSAPAVSVPVAPAEDGAVARTGGETQAADEPSTAPLDKLAWMVGEWIDEDETSKVETSVGWTKNRTFLRRLFRVTPREGEPHNGLQIIGWDPAEKTIRSWTYDSDGGFGEEKWKESGDRWIIRTSYTLVDGEKASATNILKKVNDDRFTFRSTNRVIGGVLHPDIDEVTVMRKGDEGDALPPAAATEPAATPATEAPAQEKKP